MGAPSSPGVSNALCFDLDAALAALASRHGVTYTRYSDDLFFSCDRPGVLRPIEDDVRKTAALHPPPHGLKINAKKTRHASKRGTRRVTGIVLGSDAKIHVGRPLKRKIRALVHRLDTLQTDERKKLAGYIAYVSSIDADFVNALALKYGSASVNKARKP